MYHHATFCPLSRVRFFVVCAMLLVGVVKMGYGQRVYADETQQSPRLSLLGIVLSEVTNSGFSVDTDTSNHSTLSVTLGALGAITAQQNLQFKAITPPLRNSPVVIKIGSTSSLLNLLGGFSVQRTNGGRTTPVSPNYTGNQLINLLNLFGGSTIGAVIIPPNNQVYDGVRLEVNTTLGGLLEAYYYYAFYITPPVLENNEIFRCEGESGEAVITNFQNGYTYRLYTAEIGGTEIAGTATITGTLVVPSDLNPDVNYWLEAREDDIYPSARVQIDITPIPHPGKPQLSISSITN